MQVTGRTKNINLNLTLDDCRQLLKQLIFLFQNERIKDKNIGITESSRAIINTLFAVLGFDSKWDWNSKTPEDVERVIESFRDILNP